MVHIFQLSYPGVFLELPDRDQRSRAYALLSHLETCLDDVAITLELFENRPESRHMPDWEAINMVKAGIQAELIKQAPDNGSNEEMLAFFWKMGQEVDVQAVEQYWADGRWPQRYILRLGFVYARGFVDAVHMVGLVLSDLAKEPGFPAALDKVSDAFDAALPTVKGVRDSAQHANERVRGRARGKPIRLQPVINDLFQAAGGGLLVAGVLAGDRYGFTLADGSYAEVEVSLATAQTVHSFVQQAIDQFAWRGEPRISAADLS